MLWKVERFSNERLQTLTDKEETVSKLRTHIIPVTMGTLSGEPPWEWSVTYPDGSVLSDLVATYSEARSIVDYFAKDWKKNSE